MSKNKIALIAIVLIVAVVLFSSFTKAKPKVKNCYEIPDHLEPWTDDDWYGNGVEYLKTLFNARYSEFGIQGEGASSETVNAYAVAFMKAIGLKVTKSNVMRYEKEIEAYLLGTDKTPHWKEKVGRLRCGYVENSALTGLSG
jgi:hypothetical protein